MDNKMSAPEVRRKAIYATGKTTFYACKKDARFSYCMYVPPDYKATNKPPKLIVSMHGTLRMVTVYRDAFAEYGKYNNCVVIAPLFPVGVAGDENQEGYKYIQEGDIRYDLILLAMVEEAAARLNTKFAQFSLFGFSGGGHFAHRFLYLHPERLEAVTIGAPGAVTLLDNSREWWIGTKNLKTLFGIELNIAAMRQVAVQIIVGGADIESWEINYQPGSVQYLPGCNDTGNTRVERSKSLQKNLQQHGITAKLTIVPGASHQVLKVIDSVIEHFYEVHRLADQSAPISLENS